MKELIAREHTAKSCSYDQRPGIDLIDPVDPSLPFEERWEIAKDLPPYEKATFVRKEILNLIRTINPEKKGNNPASAEIKLSEEEFRRAGLPVDLMPAFYHYYYEKDIDSSTDGGVAFVLGVSDQASLRNADDLAANIALTGSVRTDGIKQRSLELGAKITVAPSNGHSNIIPVVGEQHSGLPEKVFSTSSLDEIQKYFRSLKNDSLTLTRILVQSATKTVEMKNISQIPSDEANH